jgi:hypothetical protein
MTWLHHVYSIHTSHRYIQYNADWNSIELFPTHSSFFSLVSNLTMAAPVARTMPPSTTSNEAIFYFAFGAMVNPTSRSRRGVETVRERPAILRDFELSFSLTGAATVNPVQGQEVHGVLMEFQDEEHWKIIQEFEMGYDVLNGPVYPYDSQDAPIQAHYFQIPPGKIQTTKNANTDTDKRSAPRKPQERYLKIIASGMVHHGVDLEYVQRNIKSVDSIPTRQPHEYLYFPLIKTEGELPLFTWEEYISRTTASNPCFLVGEKVIEVVNPDKEAPFQKFLEGRMLGKKCCAFTMYQLLYEPDLPACKEEGDLQYLHYQWAENQLFDYFKETDVQARTIGKLLGKE